MLLHLHETTWEGKSIGTEHTLVAARGWEEGWWGVTNGTGFSLEGWKCFGTPYKWRSYNIVKILNAMKWYLFKWLILCYGNFTSIKQKTKNDPETSPITVSFTRVRFSPWNVCNTQWDSPAFSVYHTSPLSPVETPWWQSFLFCRRM